MLRRTLQTDGGLEVEGSLLGPAVFLDVWAVRELSREASAHLGVQLAKAIRRQNGSLLVSSAWVTEMEALRGEARSRAARFLGSLRQHWIPINPIISAVVEREAKGRVGAFISQPVLEGFVLERAGELQREDIDPYSVAEDLFFDLGRVLEWASADAAVQSAALKTAAKARADANQREQRKDRHACDRLYPRVPFDSANVLCVHNALWREATRRSPGRTWMPNDGFDVTHLIPAVAIGGFITADKAWAEILRTVIPELPSQHVRIFEPGELGSLIGHLDSLRVT